MNKILKGTCGTCSCTGDISGLRYLLASTGCDSGGGGGGGGVRPEVLLNEPCSAPPHIQGLWVQELLFSPENFCSPGSQLSHSLRLACSMAPAVGYQVCSACGGDAVLLTPAWSQESYLRYEPCGSQPAPQPGHPKLDVSTLKLLSLRGTSMLPTPWVFTAQFQLGNK